MLNIKKLYIGKIIYYNLYPVEIDAINSCKYFRANEEGVPEIRVVPLCHTTVKEPNDCSKVMLQKTGNWMPINDPKLSLKAPPKQVEVFNTPEVDNLWPALYSTLVGLLKKGHILMFGKSVHDISFKIYLKNNTLCVDKESRYPPVSVITTMCKKTKDFYWFYEKISGEH